MHASQRLIQVMMDGKEMMRLGKEAESRVTESETAYHSDEGSAADNDSGPGCESQLHSGLDPQLTIPCDFDVVIDDKGTLMTVEHFGGVDDVR